MRQRKRRLQLQWLPDIWTCPAQLCNHSGIKISNKLLLSGGSRVDLSQTKSSLLYKCMYDEALKKTLSRCIVIHFQNVRVTVKFTSYIKLCFIVSNKSPPVFTISFLGNILSRFLQDPSVSFLNIKKGLWEQPFPFDSLQLSCGKPRLTLLSTSPSWQVLTDLDKRSRDSCPGVSSLVTY